MVHSFDLIDDITPNHWRWHRKQSQPIFICTGSNKTTTAEREPEVLVFSIHRILACFNFLFNWALLDVSLQLTIKLLEKLDIDMKWGRLSRIHWVTHYLITRVMLHMSSLECDGGVHIRCDVTWKCVYISVRQHSPYKTVFFRLI
jgi:hypothetical protein